MSTRALYTFKGTEDYPGNYNVYKHSDNYPSGAADAIHRALTLAWPLPRYEADEFAASFVAANKRQAGGVRLMPSGNASKVAQKNCTDIDYRYEISFKTQISHSTFHHTEMCVMVKVYAVNYAMHLIKPKTEERMIYFGELNDFFTWADNYQG